MSSITLICLLKSIINYSYNFFSIILFVSKNTSYYNKGTTIHNQTQINTVKHLKYCGLNKYLNSVFRLSSLQK